MMIIIDNRCKIKYLCVCVCVFVCVYGCVCLCLCVRVYAYVFACGCALNRVQNACTTIRYQSGEYILQQNSHSQQTTVVARRRHSTVCIKAHWIHWRLTGGYEIRVDGDVAMPGDGAIDHLAKLLLVSGIGFHIRHADWKRGIKLCVRVGIDEHRLKGRIVISCRGAIGCSGPLGDVVLQELVKEQRIFWCLFMVLLEDLLEKLARNLCI